VVSKGGGSREPVPRLPKRLKDSIGSRTNWPRNPFGLTCGRVSAVQRLPSSSISESRSSKRSVNIALVCLPPHDYISRDFQIAPEGTRNIDHMACKRRLAWYRRGQINDIQEQYVDGLTRAVDELKADIICVNELGFPSKEGRPFSESMKATRDLAKERGVLIVAGSSHDTRTYYNTGHLYFPECADQCGIPFHKQVSAAQMEEGTELVSSPAARRAVWIQAFGLRIAVLVCLDLLDYSSLAPIVRLEEQIDVLLVPMYSAKMDSFEKVAQAASLAMPGGVALANVRLEGRSSGYFWLFGRQQDPRRTIELSGGGRARLFSFDLRNYKAKKHGLQGYPPKHLGWLFGLSELRSASS